MIQLNTFHLPVSDQRVSAYSSIANALGQSSISVPPPLSRRNLVPLELQKNSERTMKQFSTTWPSSVRIIFESVQESSDQAGVPMSDIAYGIHRAPGNIMKNPSEEVFRGQNFKSLHFRIWLPGYPPYDHPIALNTKSGPITRLQLAAALVNAYASYLEKTHPLPEAHADARFAQGKISLDQLVLVSLTNHGDGAGNTFHAEIDALIIDNRTNTRMTQSSEARQKMQDRNMDVERPMDGVMCSAHCH
ncbi:hypothetical protein AcV5_001447 [Taiwanofungus camphoratus]|nr:hypothetical protein AcV5_001447 [Antrodia cinnamomea]